jgi:hypothetical protein
MIGRETDVCDILLLEIGADHCCYAFLKGASNSFELIRYISFEELEAEQQLAAILDELKKTACDRIFVSSSFSQVLLVPDQYADGAASFLSGIFEIRDQKQFRDKVVEWQVTTAYSMPASVCKQILEFFPSAVFFHAYTPAMKIYNGFVATNQIDIHFTTAFFRLLVKKEGKVQLAQTYSYKTPLDVVYYLLKVCYEFGLDQSEVFLIVSGLIDQDSALYSEMHKYFLNLHFAQAPAYTLPENEHPHHYFTSLYKLAACVS